MTPEVSGIDAYYIRFILNTCMFGLYAAHERMKSMVALKRLYRM